MLLRNSAQPASGLVHSGGMSIRSVQKLSRCGYWRLKCSQVRFPLVADLYRGFHVCDHSAAESPDPKTSVLKGGNAPGQQSLLLTTPVSIVGVYEIPHDRGSADDLVHSKDGLIKLFAHWSHQARGRVMLYGSITNHTKGD